MGGLKWRPGDGSNVEDHRFDPPVVRSIADAVDGPTVTPRCAQCKGGTIPDVLIVQVREAINTPAIVLSCAACRVPLSDASIRKLNHERIQVVQYDDAV